MTRRDDDKSKSEERGREGGTGSFEIRPFFSFFLSFPSLKKKKQRKGPLAGYIYKTRCIRLAFPTMLHFSSILHG